MGKQQNNVEISSCFYVRRKCRNGLHQTPMPAIMDDVNFWGPTEDVLDAYEYMAGELATLRLIANEKTTLHPSAAEHRGHVST